MSIAAILISSFSITISSKINDYIDFNFELSGDGFMKIIMMAYSLAGNTGYSGDCITQSIVMQKCRM